ncbi:hypothetical protein [Maridesulfovibrio salexigens]|uniref:hypothetical protein n=1 Tax=Maridesulfovibrio salexigens TaxID=880 RepID=UPI00030814FB|nr:hypothetical protein [Maridesulfovibrio salexigens]
MRYLLIVFFLCSLVACNETKVEKTEQDKTISSVDNKDEIDVQDIQQSGKELSDKVQQLIDKKYKKAEE